MFERLGIITNCWRKSLERGEQFEDLVEAFCRKGFREIEIRDGDYLRQSSVGPFLNEIEKIIPEYDPAEWREISDRIHERGGWQQLVHPMDLPRLKEAERLVDRTKGAFFSYAITHPWLSRRTDIDVDNRLVTAGFGFAYLMNPRCPRFRLVSLEPIEDLDAEAAVKNLVRYGELAREARAEFTVENARHAADVIHRLALSGGALLTYDEANNYRLDGTELSNSRKFRLGLRKEDLASVHMKQKGEEGVSPHVHDGYVDLGGVLAHLREIGYSGDLLLEFAPTDDPLAVAVESRDYLNRMFGG